MPRAPIPFQEAIATGALFAALTASSLWDYRLFNLRIFDGAALALFAVWLVLSPEPLEGFMERRRRYWLLFATIVVYAAIGYWLLGHKSSLAIIGLSAIGFLLSGREDWLRRVGPYLWVIVGIHIVFFAIQFGAYYGFNHTLIDFQELIGQKSRLIVNEDHMRAAALFQEPNSYCLNLFLLSSLAILWRNNRLLVLLSGFTMILSESLWGLGAGLVLIFMGEIRRGHSWRQLAYTLAAAFVALGALFYAYLWVYKKPVSDVPYFYLRMRSLLIDDGSVNERYFKTACAQANASVEPAPESRITSMLLGEGLSTVHFERCLPANGISFLLKSLGAAGTILLLAATAIALAGLPLGAKFFVVLAIGFNFTSYPLVTYVLFWFWLPALFGLVRLPTRTLPLGPASPGEQLSR